MGKNVVLFDDNCDSNGPVMSSDSWTDLKSAVESNTVKITDIENGTVKVAEAENAVNAQTAQNSVNAENAQSAVNADAATNAVNAENAHKLAGMLPGKCANNILYANKDGNVGLGVEPEAKVHIKSDTASFLADFTNDSLTGGLLVRDGNDTNCGGLICYGETNTGRENEVHVKNYKAGDLAFHTNDTECMRIDENGNVGVGLDSPQSKLHVKTGGYEPIRVETTDSGSRNWIAYHDLEGLQGYVGYGSGADEHFTFSNTRNASFRFVINGDEKVRIDENGDISPSTNGQMLLGNETNQLGRVFSRFGYRCGNEGSDDPESLDWYEEGTGAGSNAYASWDYQYTRVGNLVHVEGGTTYTSNGNIVATLPFSGSIGHAKDSGQITKSSAEYSGSDSFCGIYGGGSQLYAYSYSGATRFFTSGSVYWNITYFTDN